MNTYEMKDLLGRNLFIKNFSTRFKCIVATDSMCKHDLNMTGTTTATYANEIKIRKNSSTEYRSTILEEEKVQHFKDLMARDKRRICLYTVFFSDGIVITYNITARIEEAKDPSYRWKFTPHKKNCRNNNTGNSYTIPKAVYDLEYNVSYGDRKNKYEISENN